MTVFPCLPRPRKRGTLHGCTPDGCHASADLKDLGYAGFRSSARRAVNGCEKTSSRAFSTPKDQATSIASRVRPSESSVLEE
jgi:hypothetical protein